MISNGKIKSGAWGGTCLVEAACTCRRCVRELNLFGEVIFLHGNGYCMRDRVRDSMLRYGNDLSVMRYKKAIWLRHGLRRHRTSHLALLSTSAGL